MNTLLLCSCCTNCKDYFLASSENVKIAMIICFTIVSLAFITAIALLLYYMAKRISDGKQTKRDYQKMVLDHIKKQLENGTTTIDNDYYIKKYTKGCCFSYKCSKHKE